MADNFSDVTVDLGVQTPSAVIGLGVPAVLVKATGDSPKASLTKYTSLATLDTKYGADADVYKVVKTIFDQDNRPDHVDVIEYNDIATDVPAYWGDDWTFILLATNTVADAGSLSMAVEQLGEKFAVVQVEKSDDLKTIGAQKWTIGAVLPAGNGRLDAAMVGNIASLTVGSVNWKFRDVVDVTPYEDVTMVEYEAIKANHGITYKKRGSFATTSNDQTLDGSYIDDLHGRIWTTVNIQNSLQDFLNSNAKVAYNASGIGLLLGVLSNVLNTAFQNGIIDAADDGSARFTTAAGARSTQAETDVQNRLYKGLSYTYVPAQSIDGVAVRGTVILP